MNISRKLLFAALLLIATGILGLMPYANMLADKQAAVANAQPVTVQSRPLKPETVSGKPVRLQVPSLGLDLTVADGAYNQADGSWTLSKDKAHFALPSAPANNEAGNTLVYGHNRSEIFAALHTMQPGATAIITTDSGYVFTYMYTQQEIVEPTATEIFGYQGAPRLTLQTCTGRWFEQRQFFYFSLLEYEKV